MADAAARNRLPGPAETIRWAMLGGCDGAVCVAARVSKRCDGRDWQPGGRLRRVPTLVIVWALVAQVFASCGNSASSAATTSARSASATSSVATRRSAQQPRSSGRQHLQAIRRGDALHLVGHRRTCWRQLPHSSPGTAGQLTKLGANTRTNGECTPNGRTVASTPTVKAMSRPLPSQRRPATQPTVQPGTVLDDSQAGTTFSLQQ